VLCLNDYRKYEFRFLLWIESLLILRVAKRKNTIDLFAINDLALL
jgi:hypothetical protein